MKTTEQTRKEAFELAAKKQSKYPSLTQMIQNCKSKNLKHKAKILNRKKVAKWLQCIIAQVKEDGTLIIDNMYYQIVPKRSTFELLPISKIENPEKEHDQTAEVAQHVHADSLEFKTFKIKGYSKMNETVNMMTDVYLFKRWSLFGNVELIYNNCKSFAIATF